MTRTPMRGLRWGVSRLVRLAMLVMLVTTAGCRTPDAPLAHTFESPEALAAAVLEGLASADAAGLKALPLSEEEFRQHVWPKLPVSRPERNMPFDYVWNDLSGKSRAYLAETLASQPTRGASLVKVLFDGETTDYGSFTVMRKARLVVRDQAGEDKAVRVFGSVMRTNGRYKLFSYVTD